MNTDIFDRTPCADAREWLATQPNLKTAWETCERGDWMWWALIHFPGALPKKKTSVAYARWNARRAKKFDAYAASASSAAYAASDASSAASAAYAASSAASAAYAASSAASYAAYAAYAAERKAQADWIRKHVPFPLEGINE